MAGTQDILLEALNDIRQKVHEMHASQAVSEHRLDTLHEETKKISRTIHGDSEPEHGMFPRLVAVERQVSEIQEKRRAVAGWAWTAVGAAIVSGITALWNGSRHP